LKARWHVTAIIRTGSGTFQGWLVHHRRSIFGRCVTYFATVTGTVTLTF
jgi:hypothetical protein